MDKYTTDFLGGDILLRRALPLLSSLILMLALASCLSASQEPPASADVVVLHGRIYTLDAKHPWAEAIAIRGERILAVGKDREILRHQNSSTKIIDAKGRLVLPAFTDCHVHFMDGSRALQQVALDDAKTIAEIQQRVKAFAVTHPNDPWVLGRGWSYPLFPPSGLPDKKYLDEIIPDRPVYLEGFDGHTWWANSAALAAAHVTQGTSDPPGGTIVRDATTGEPTGAIKEDAADAIIRRAIPELSPEEKLQALHNGIKLANQFGLARVHVLGGVNAGHDDLENVELLEELRQSGELTLRFYLASRLDPPEMTDKELEAIVRASKRYHDDWIAAGSAKIFLDGVIETHTAAMLAPYSDDPRLSGELLWDPGKYKQFVAELDRAGIQVSTHAIGDRAIRLALDAYEDAATKNGTHDMRHRVEHIEDPSAADIPRFGKLGVIASMQPLHAYPNDDILKSWAPNVGPERAQRGWPWHSIQSAGGLLAFGSDWPIVTLSPWPGLQTAVTRETTAGQPKGGWIPAERIRLPDAIRGYTLNAAFAGHREKNEGSIESGKLADLIIVSQDLFKIQPEKMGDTKVLLTLVGGRVVYEAHEF